jgi:hypothetical protein
LLIGLAHRDRYRPQLFHPILSVCVCECVVG